LTAFEQGAIMKRFLASLAILAGTTAFAVAADMVVKAPPSAMAPTYSWTGFYVGGTGGAAWGSFDPSTSTVCVPGDYLACINVPAVNAAGAQSIKPAAFTGGFETGYNWQANSFVVGLEGDIETLHLSGGATTTALYPGAPPGGVCPASCFTISSSASTNWVATARGRVGYAVNNWLFFATGGAAFTSLHANFSFMDPTPAAEALSFSGSKTGYAVGGGAEAGLWGNWTVKVEYLYVNFGTVSATGTFTIPLPQPMFHSIDLKANIARAGLNYRF
jgi:outer membrane immunogenic protein